MRVLISAVGTRGDVQPALALAAELRALGREVRLCVPPNFVAWASALGFEALPMGVAMAPPRPGAPQAPLPDLITDQFDTVGAAAKGCDLIVGAGAHQYAVRSVAMVLGVPCVVAVYAPTSLPSPELAPHGRAEPSQEATLRAWAETRRAWNERSLERVNANRTRLGLANVDDVIAHVLSDDPWLAADAALAPTPATPGMKVVQAGAWILPDSTPLPAEVEAFLREGEAPVYLGLGSMPAPESASRLLIEATRAAGRRAILSSGWAGLAPIDDAQDCLAVGDVNQQALFPRLAAVVHHGGAGTTTIAARAGAPQVATPMFGDQFYWSERIRALGLGGAASFVQLSAETLAEALAHALSPAVAERARTFAAAVATDGAASAARRLSETLG